MAKKTNAQLETELLATALNLTELQSTVGDLLEEYREDLCDSGLTDARVKLEPLGVKFPGSNFIATLVNVTLRNVPSDAISGWGATTSMFDSELRAAITERIGSKPIKFVHEGAEVEVDFSDAELDSVEREDY